MLNVLEELEQRLYDEDIEVYERDLKSTKAIAVKINGCKAIAYDPDKMISLGDLRVAWEHEYEHHNQPKTMYDFDTSIYARRRREGIIDRSLIKRVLPLEKLKPFLISQTPLYEIAEELFITEAIIRAAINYYKDLEKVTKQ